MYRDQWSSRTAVEGQKTLLLLLLHLSSGGCKTAPLLGQAKVRFDFKILKFLGAKSFKRFDRLSKPFKKVIGFISKTD